MVQTALNAMIYMLLAKFMLNDVPHAAGILGSPDYGRPPTPGQLRYITVLCQQLKITTPYEERVKTFGEAGRFIRELEAERDHTKKLSNPSISAFRVERTTVDQVIDNLERTWHRIESDMDLRMQSSLGILKEVMGYYYEEPCVVAWDNSDLIGIAVYETIDDKNMCIRNTNIKEIASFTHRSGVGKLLIEEVMRIGREEGSDIVSASYAPGAKGFYERLGFVQNTYYSDNPTLMMYRLKNTNLELPEVVITEIGGNITAHMSGIRATAELSRLLAPEAVSFDLEPDNWLWFNRLINQSGIPRVGSLLLDRVLEYCGEKSYSIVNQVSAYGAISQKELEDWYIRKGFSPVDYKKYGNTLLKWEGPESNGSPKNLPTGTCYEDAWHYLIKKGEGYLIHGSVQLSAEGARVNHAWVELLTGWVWEPQTKDYYTIEDFETFSPMEEHRYTVEEAAIMVARVGKHGPWSAAERMKHIGR